MKKAWIIGIGILLIYLVIMIVVFSDNDGKKALKKEEKKTVHEYFKKDRDFKDDATVITANNDGIADILDSLKELNATGYNNPKPATYQMTKLSSDNISYFNHYVKAQDLTNLSVNEKVQFDFDSDGKDEQLLIISNIDNKSVSKWISAVYYIDDSVNRIRLEEYKGKDKDNLKFRLVNIVDLNNDGNYEIILSKKSINYEEPCLDLYELEEGKYEAIVFCTFPTV